jgi:hypothetical protein
MACNLVEVSEKTGNIFFGLSFTPSVARVERSVVV